MAGSKKQWVIVLLTIGVIVLGWFLSGGRQKDRFEAIPMKAQKTLKGWRERPFTGIRSPEFSSKLSTVATELQTTMTAQQEERLRQTVLEFLVANSSSDFAEYQKFAAARQATLQSSPDRMEMLNHMKRQLAKAHVDAVSLSGEQVIAKVWKHVFRNSGGPLKGVDLTSMKLQVYRVAGSYNYSELVKTGLGEENVGVLAGVPLFQTTLDRDSSPTLLARVSFICQSKPPEPCFPVRFVFRWVQPIENWALEMWSINYSGPRRYDWFM